jgi:hypothetical protein
MIVALGHYSRTGKDTFVRECIAEIKRIDPTIPCHRFSFASKLKDISHQLFGGFGLEDEEFYNTPEGEKYRDIKLPIIDLTPVEIWIGVGNKLREVYPEVWRDYVLLNRKPGVTFIADTRFPNEFWAIREDSPENLLIKMIRPGVGPRQSKSDRALLDIGRLDWDFVMGGTLEDVIEDARDIAAYIAGLRDLPPRHHDREQLLGCAEIDWLAIEKEELCVPTTA